MPHVRPGQCGFRPPFRATLDDAETSKLLGKIYRDVEIPALAAARAKGFTLNLEGRRAAGLARHFIAELEGRTPSVFVFSPFAEGRIAEGKAFNPTKYQAQLAGDLENLPQFLCRQDDIVLVRNRPSVDFLSGIKQAGLPLPEFVEIRKPLAPFLYPSAGESMAEGRERGIHGLVRRKLGRLRPWAWSPASVELLAPLFANMTAEKRTEHQRLNDHIAQLYSKAWSAELLRKILACRRRGIESLTPSRKSSQSLTSSPTENWLCTEHEVGVAVDSLDAALEAIARIRRRGHHKIVVKEAVGLAGSNAMRLFEPEILETHRRWLTNSLAKRRQLVVEPWLEREVDFSVQLEMTPAGLRLCGYTGLLNDAKGQFQGNWAEPHHHTRIPARVVAVFREPPNISHRLLQLYTDIFALLQVELRRADYLGPLGIDAFVYRDDAGLPRLKPIVEINTRYTMGRVTVELMRQTYQGRFGLFRPVNRTAAHAKGFTDFAAYARSLSERFPLQLEGEPRPGIREGALCLNDPTRAEVCLAVFHVSRQFEALPMPETALV